MGVIGLMGKSTYTPIAIGASADKWENGVEEGGEKIGLMGESSDVLQQPFDKLRIRSGLRWTSGVNKNKRTIRPHTAYQPTAYQRKGKWGEWG